MAFSFDDFLKTVPLGELAERFGVSEQEVTQAVSLSAPALLGGMAVNASTDEGASKLIKATEKHTTQAASLAEIDTEDGSKIIKKVLGEKESDVTSALSAKADSGIAGLIPKLLPFIAPLIMQFLSGNLSKASTESASQTQNGGLGEILGGLLGGSSSQNSSGGLGDILGGLIGGGSSGSSGGIGDILGGLLGGDSSSSSKKSEGGLGDILGGLLGR